MANKGFSENFWEQLMLYRIKAFFWHHYELHELGEQEVQIGYLFFSNYEKM
jgi:hypothetical protein